MNSNCVDSLSNDFDRMELDPKPEPITTTPIQPAQPYTRPSRHVRAPKIKTVGPGWLEIPDVGAGPDFKLYPGGGKFWDWSETRTKPETGILVSDVEELVAHGATTVILSLGRENELHVDPATLRYLAERDITVIVASTWKAARLYCELVDSRPIGALLLWYPGKQSAPRTLRHVDEHEL
jgi:hypothetical protein